MLWPLLYYGWILSEVCIAVITRTRQGEGRVSDRGSMPLLWVAIVFSMTLCQWLRQVLAPSFPHSFRTVAEIILTCGLALRWLAVISLGQAFSANVAIRRSQTVNQSGVYRLVRHPSYSGLLLIFLAVGLHSRNFICLFSATVLPAAALLYRIHIEEAALIAGFGQDYRFYMTRTRRLIPWIF